MADEQGRRQERPLGLSSLGLLNRIWYAGTYSASLVQVVPGTPGFVLGTATDLPIVIDGAKRDRAI